MIIKENGLRYAKLIHVSIDNGLTSNSNKVYIMEEQSDGKIKCQYGRVGNNLATEYKDISKWNSVYKQKISKTKGYTDVTEMFIETEIDNASSSTIKEIEDKVVKQLIDDLMAYANKSIQKNYKVTQSSVTELQINSAQEILNQISSTLNLKSDVKVLNELLLKLYTIIPRNMKDVKDYLLKPINNKQDLEKAKEFINSEQETLDVMAGQVQLLKKQKEDSNNSEDIKQDLTILDQLGLKVEIETDNEKLDLIKKLMGHNAHQIRKVFKVINKKTQRIFDNNFELAKVKKRRLYWHGSRNQNWFNILQTGLLIRPSGAIHTGSMWDDGIYFASDSDKSLGYTDGGRWAGGSRNNKVFLGLFDVHVGKQLNKYKHDSSCYKISKEVEAGGYDSVHAHKGIDLRKDEYIIYKSQQTTISHLIEVEF
jgi:poly [ADP-ribose] polymerase